MRNVADNLSALLTIVQAVVSIISLALSLIVLVKLRQLIRGVTGLPSTAVNTVRGKTAAVWERLTRWRE